MYKIFSAIRRGLTVLMTITGLTFFSITPGLAIPLTFEFKFANVTGTILGLSDDANDQQASSVIFSVPPLAPVDVLSAGPATTNLFSVDANGDLTAVDFRVNTFDVFATLSLTNGALFLRALNPPVPGGLPSPPIIGEIFYKSITEDLTPIPLPPALVLFLTGLIGLGALSRRRKSQVVA